MKEVKNVRKMENDIDTELNKIKVVLLALWENKQNLEAEAIIEIFKDELEEIRRGN